MIHYSILPEEVVFAETGSDEKKEKLVEIDGVQVIVRANEDGDYELVQLLSSDPNLFLDPKYEPGKTISLRPGF